MNAAPDDPISIELLSSGATKTMPGSVANVVLTLYAEVWLIVYGN